MAAGPRRSSTDLPASKDAPTPSGEAGPTEWRTTPLWGVAASAPYLHDGRAPTLNEAILLHGGEAELTSKRYTALSFATARRCSPSSTPRSPRRSPVGRPIGPPKLPRRSEVSRIPGRTGPPAFPARPLDDLRRDRRGLSGNVPMILA